MTTRYIKQCISEKREDLLILEQRALNGIINRFAMNGALHEPKVHEEYQKCKNTLHFVTEARENISKIIRG